MLRDSVLLDARGEPGVRTWLVAGLLFLGSWVTACGGGPTRSMTERVDSAGVELVTSSGPDRPLDWSFSQMVAIGGDETGPASFTSVAAGTVGSDASGRLYVLDSHEHRVVVFDSSGAYVGSLGREGGGPGELRFPIGLAVRPDGIADIFDVGKRALVSLSLDRDPLPETSFPFSTERGVRHYASTSEGWLVARVRGGEDQGVDLVGWSRTGSGDTLRLTGMTTEDVPAEFDCMALRLRPVFAPALRWAHSAGRVAATSSVAYEVDLFESEGTRVRSVRRDIIASPASREAAIAAAEPGMRLAGGDGVCEITPEAMVDAIGYETSIPVVADIRVSPTGELWVERFDPRAQSEGRSGPIDVFDATGAYVGTLPVGSPLPLLLLSRDRIVVVERDALDVERLVLIRVGR